MILHHNTISNYSILKSYYMIHVMAYNDKAKICNSVSRDERALPLRGMNKGNWSVFASSACFSFQAGRGRILIYCEASMDEVIHSAPWSPWMKSSIVPVALPPVWCPWMKSPAIVPAALSYLSFQAASRWTKTVIPNLWLRRTRGI
jgi:hypothetical protein